MVCFESWSSLISLWLKNTALYSRLRWIREIHVMSKKREEIHAQSGKHPVKMFLRFILGGEPKYFSRSIRHNKYQKLLRSSRFNQEIHLLKAQLHNVKVST
ncbi:hypothetical protein YC2023_022834 [Brassica napus]